MSLIHGLHCNQFFFLSAGNSRLFKLFISQKEWLFKSQESFDRSQIPVLEPMPFSGGQCWSTCMNEFYHLTQQRRRRCLLLPVWFTSQLESFLLLEKKQLSSPLPSSLCTKRKNATFNILLWPAWGSLPVQAQVLFKFHTHLVFLSFRN